MLDVIIPTFNRNSYLKKSIKSVINQSFPPKNIIVIDDYGLSNLKKIIDIFKKKTSIEIKYFKTCDYNLTGALQARNLGVRISKAKFIAFLDDDDTWGKNYLKSINKIIIKNKNIDLIISNFYSFIDNKKKVLKTIPKKFFIKDYLIGNPGALCSNLVISKKTFEQLKGFDFKISGAADKDLFIRANLLKKNIFINHQRDICYRIHPSQWSRDYKKILFQKIIFFIKYFKYYLNVKIFYKFIKEIFKYIIFIIKK